MTGRWVVLKTSAPWAAWVIDGDREVADAFAAFVTTEIDPAIAVPAGSPVGELLAWREGEAAGWPLPGPAAQQLPGEEQQRPPVHAPGRWRPVV
jgi:hypothetical protein